MIFVDSDAFLGLSVKKDAHFKKAWKLMEYLEEQEDQLVTSWQVVDEVTTKLSFYAAKKKALDFLKWIKKQTSKRVSLTDCTNMVIAKKLGVKTFFSFDKHYEKNGFELLKV